MSAIPTPMFRSERRPRKLVSYTPTTTAVPIYICPNTAFCTITAIVSTNIHSSSTTIYIYHVRPTETVANSNALYYDVTLAKNSVTQDDGPKYLGPGDALWVSCSTGNHATITLYGIEE